MPEGEGVPDVEEEEPAEKDEQEIINEQMFTFDQFEKVDICTLLLTVHVYSP